MVRRKWAQKRHAFLLRAPKELADKIKAAAAANGWSVNKEIDARLERALADVEVQDA